jgi:hypothetical protein
MAGTFLLRAKGVKNVKNLSLPGSSGGRDLMAEFLAMGRGRSRVCDRASSRFGRFPHTKIVTRNSMTKLWEGPGGRQRRRRKTVFMYPTDRERSCSPFVRDRMAQK